MKKTTSSLSVLAVAIGLAVIQPIHAGEIQQVEGLKTSGYGRAAFGATGDRLVSPESNKANNGMNIIQTAGNPYKPTGNLGNQASQLELHVDYGISKNDMNWVTHINMFTGASDFEESTTASDYFYLDEWWVSGTGIFPSNPGAGLWMGKRYYGRYENSLNGYQHTNADGIGAGVDNFDLGFGKLNVAVVKDGWGRSTNEFCSSDLVQNPDTGKWECPAEKGWGGAYYSLVTKLHGMEITDNIKGDIFANYRTYIGSDGDMEPTPENPDYMTANDNHPDGFQAGFALKQGEWGEFNRLVVRYGYKVPTSTTQSWLHIPSYQIGGFFDGMQEYGENYRLQYAYSHESAVYNDNVQDVKINGDLPYESTTWNQFVVRGTYIWNQRYSTKLELAYDQMDFDVLPSKGESGTNSSYKVTLAQDFHLGSGFWDRPVIRFFVTYGKLDTETTAYSTLADWRLENAIDFIDTVGKRDATTVGVMFETWW